MMADRLPDLKVIGRISTRNPRIRFLGAGIFNRGIARYDSGRQFTNRPEINAARHRSLVDHLNLEF